MKSPKETGAAAAQEIAPEKPDTATSSAKQEEVGGDERDAVLTEIRDILIDIHNLEIEQLNVLRSINSGI